MGERSFQHKIALRRSGSDASSPPLQAVVTCVLRERGDDQRDCRVTLALEECVLESCGPDFFEAFCGVREQLEPRALVPLCYGASRNVFPSRMSRQRSLGLQAYRLEPGRAGRKEDMVEIFATGEDLDPASGADQRHYFDQWLTTLAHA
jgi:hypothetical protein